MSKENYDAKLAVFAAMPKEQITEPNIPIDVAIQEAEDLYGWCQVDKDALEMKGLDWNLVTDMPVRIGACREAESIWVKEGRVLTDATLKWKEMAPKAFDMRDVMVHEFYLAFRDNAALKSRVAHIAEGSSNADMIQDLNDLAVLGSENPESLQNTGFDMSMLTTSKELAQELGRTLGIVNGERNVSSEAKVIRDKAYTHLKEAMDEIRFFGQHVFWRNPERKRGYVSRYVKELNKPKSTEQV